MDTNSKDTDIITTTIQLLEKLRGNWRDQPTTEAASDEPPMTTPGEANRGDFASAVERAFRTVGDRLKNHARAINRLQDEEATTRNMVIHCENLIAEAEERLRLQLVDCDPGIRVFSFKQPQGTAVATDVTTQAIAEPGTSTLPAEATAL
mgnify:CR=1 FL=1